MANIFDMVDTWNAGATTFTAIRMNVTDTASAAASLLMDLQVSGASKFSVAKGGGITSVYFSASGGVFSVLSNSFLGGGISASYYIPGQFQIGGIFAIGAAVNTPDVYITRDAADILAQRNGVNAQAFNIYRTYTDASNYQRLKHSWNTSTALIMNEGAGTGADGNIAFNDAALATTATKGYIMIPSCAGPPTGVPADIPTGQVALHFDSTNNQIYVYDGGWLKTAALL